MSSVMLGSMSDAELTWVNKDDQTWMLVAVGLPLIVAFGMLFDDWLIGLSVGMALAIPFLFTGTTRSACIDGGTLTYDTGKNKKTVPVSEVARITQEPMSGSLVFEFKDGTSDYLENGGDEKGVSEFVGQAQRYVS